MPLLLSLYDAFSFCSANIHGMDEGLSRNANKPQGFYLFIQVLFVQEVIAPLQEKFLIDHNHVCAILLQQGVRQGSGMYILGESIISFRFHTDFRSHCLFILYQDVENVESSFSYHISFGWQEALSLHSLSPSEKEMWHKSQKPAAKH